jgi:uncharacterized membrane protein YeaQ/YmgE (transglycosylase-associated protein family)
MNFVSLLISLAVGAVAGSLAGTVMKGGGFGLQGKTSLLVLSVGS